MAEGWRQGVSIRDGYAGPGRLPASGVAGPLRWDGGTDAELVGSQGSDQMTNSASSVLGMARFGSRIMPAPRVRLVASSTTMKPPVARLRL